MDDVACQFLLDSGASVSVVKEGLLRCKLRRTDFSGLTSANGGLLDVVGVVDVWVEMYGLRRKIMMYVVRNLNQNCILGIDALKAFKMKMNFEEGSVSISGIEMAPVKKLLDEYSELFDGMTPGAVEGMEHTIRTRRHSPIVVPMRRVPLAYQEELVQDMKKMLEKGVIRPSQSPYRFPIVVVKKKDGTNRMCIDFRELNKVTIRDQHPLPRIDDLMDKLHGARKFCTLDLASAYWQVPLSERDKHKTAFSVPGLGHFEFNVMPFGLTNAPSTQQALMEKVLIANRGEIALRILRACRELGIKTVAMHSDADRDLKHVRMADESVCVGPAASTDSYLNVPVVISAAEVTDSGSEFQSSITL